MSYLEMRAISRVSSDCVVDLNWLRPPEISNIRGSERGQLSDGVSEVSSPCPIESQSSPRVWIENVRVRRPMRPHELAENADLFDAIDAERRGKYLYLFAPKKYFFLETNKENSWVLSIILQRNS